MACRLQFEKSGHHVPPHEKPQENRVNDTPTPSPLPPSDAPLPSTNLPPLVLETDTGLPLIPTLPPTFPQSSPTATIYVSFPSRTTSTTLVTYIAPSTSASTLGLPAPSSIINSINNDNDDDDNNNNSSSSSSSNNNSSNDSLSSGLGPGAYDGTQGGDQANNSSNNDTGNDSDRMNLVKIGVSSVAGGIILFGVMFAAYWWLCVVRVRARRKEARRRAKGKAREVFSADVAAPPGASPSSYRQRPDQAAVTASSAAIAEDSSVVMMEGFWDGAGRRYALPISVFASALDSSSQREACGAAPAAGEDASSAGGYWGNKD
ncbi:hypothetical protein VTI28DRAFT_8863 [Corynascus sepedonium]